MTSEATPEAARWRVLTAWVPTALEDDVAAVLGGGSLGVEIVPAGPGRSALRVYLGLADDPRAWCDRAARVLEAHGISTSDAPPTVEPVDDGRWVERWQAALAPMPLGRRFVVLPGASVRDDLGREPIRLIPGMAFGTGEHPTTRMCAAAVEDLVEPGSRWLDLGTGTGILAVVAARCGATRVLALDLDPEAAHVAEEVATANEVRDRVEVRAGSIADRGVETFDGIVANIQSSFFVVHAAELADALVAGGRLVVSGILHDDGAEIDAALGAAGFVIDRRERDGPWGCLVARRGAA